MRRPSVSSTMPACNPAGLCADRNYQSCATVTTEAAVRKHSHHVDRVSEYAMDRQRGAKVLQPVERGEGERELCVRGRVLHTRAREGDPFVMIRIRRGRQIV